MDGHVCFKCLLAARLTRLRLAQTYQCPLPSPCPALACAPNLTELKIIEQLLDTPLIRMHAAMSRLTSLSQRIEARL